MLLPSAATVTAATPAPSAEVASIVPFEMSRIAGNAVVRAAPAAGLPLPSMSSATAR